MRLLKTKDVAEMLQLSNQTILDWAAAGKLPGGFRLPGGAIRFDEAKVEVWLSEHAIGSRPLLQEVKE